MACRLELKLNAQCDGAVGLVSATRRWWSMANTNPLGHLSVPFAATYGRATFMRGSPRQAITKIVVHTSVRTLIAITVRSS